MSTQGTRAPATVTGPATAGPPGPPAAHAPTHAPQTGSDPLATGTAGAIAIGDTAATGTADNLARSDHRHSLAAPAMPAAQVVGAGTAGVATAPARGDHVHPMSAPVAAGSLLAIRLLQFGNWTPTPGTTKAYIQGIGGGGGGGGAQQGIGTAGCGGGGGSGQYIQHWATGIGAGPYPATYGAGGTGGAAGNNPGNVGSPCTLDLTGTVPSVILSCAGGQGGLSMAAASFASYARGGAAGIGATNANISSNGSSNGDYGARDSASQHIAGGGGSSPLGKGADQIQGVSSNGNAGAGFGAGGGGGNATDAGGANRTGGDGTAGCWIIYEFS